MWIGPTATVRPFSYMVSDSPTHIKSCSWGVPNAMLAYFYRSLYLYLCCLLLCSRSNHPARVREEMEAFHKVEDIHGRTSIRDEDDEDIGCPSSSSSSSSSSDSSNSQHSSSSDFMDDATTCFSSSSNSPTTTSAKGHVGNALFEMSALLEDLPIKRGLSRHFQGKSQSFTSLANAKSLEDLVKPVRAFNRKRNIKSCKSYGGGLDAHKPLSPRGITKKDRSFVGLRRNGFSMGRPPTHPHNSSGNLSSQAFLFAR